MSIPQEGSFTTIVGPPITIDFPGFVPITPAKIELKHQFALMPTIGRSFGKVTNWVWGGAAQVGATYTIGPRWFLDLAYTFARSEEFKIKNAASFSNSNGPLTSSGVAFLNTREQITKQSVVLTLNRQF